MYFLSDGTATKEMDGVAADDLQRATCASLAMVFTQVATVDEVIQRIAAEPPAGDRDRRRTSAVPA